MLYSLAATNILSVNLLTNVTLTYDTNGNLTGDGTRTFYYDAENRLTNVFVTTAWKTEFAYDGFGRRRIERDYAWVSGNWSRTNETRFIFDGFVPIQERDSNNAVLVTYTRGLDLSGGINGAGGIGGLLARTDGNGSTFYHADGAGNVTALMDGNQNIVARYEYDPYGRMLGMWGKMGPVNVMRFSSMPHFQTADIIGYHARFYVPGFQRWLNQDPIGEAGGVNLYGFVGNSPVNAGDAYGWEPGDAEVLAMVKEHHYRGWSYSGWEDYFQQHPHSPLAMALRRKNRHRRNGRKQSKRLRGVAATATQEWVRQWAWQNDRSSGDCHKRHRGGGARNCRCGGRGLAFKACEQVQSVEETTISTHWTRN